MNTQMARPAGLEPAASRLEVSRSIQMSYGRALIGTHTAYSVLRGLQSPLVTTYD
jgi:hypothetical protein